MTTNIELSPLMEKRVAAIEDLQDHQVAQILDRLKSHNIGTGSKIWSGLDEPQLKALVLEMTHLLENLDKIVFLNEADLSIRELLGEGIAIGSSNSYEAMVMREKKDPDLKRRLKAIDKAGVRERNILFNQISYMGFNPRSLTVGRLKEITRGMTVFFDRLDAIAPATSDAAAELGELVGEGRSIG